MSQRIVTGDQPIIQAGAFLVLATADHLGPGKAAGGIGALVPDMNPPSLSADLDGAQAGAQTFAVKYNLELSVV